ncbi:NUDIX domain-containing protein [Kribbella sp. HUAS MG21]|uniref:NUDIX domain-containing protein n=1 Tax=Kribbella sp. HUAS MG21 TaxID=3160966 RepID=A0AAU7TJ83_9ACTN
MDFEPLGLATDLVILTVRDGRLQVLLIRRGIPPYQGRWALPGGFVRPDEDLETTARRELAEETGLAAERIHLEQVATYGAPDRDPRGRVVSVAYLALVPDLPAPTAGSDAASAAWINVTDALANPLAHPPTAKPSEARGDVRGEVQGDAPGGARGEVPGGVRGEMRGEIQGEVPGDERGGGVRLAFDHGRILSDAVERARAKLEYSPLATAFCPPEFTISELRGVYEAVWGIALDPRNFHRKVTKTPNFVTPIGATTTRDGGRPAQLFRRGTAATLHPPMTRG